MSESDYQEIEKMSDLKEKAKTNITFDNEGHMLVNNRQFRRERKRLWRAVTEKQKSIHAYTKPNNKKTAKQKKQERQNRRKGRK